MTEEQPEQTPATVQDQETPSRRPIRIFGPADPEDYVTIRRRKIRTDLKFVCWECGKDWHPNQQQVDDLRRKIKIESEAAKTERRESEQVAIYCSVRCSQQSRRVFRAGATCVAPCTPACPKPAWKTGLCNAHYRRRLRGRRIDVPLRDRRGKLPPQEDPRFQEIQSKDRIRNYKIVPPHDLEESHSAWEVEKLAKKGLAPDFTKVSPQALIVGEVEMSHIEPIIWSRPPDGEQIGSANRKKDAQ